MVPSVGKPRIFRRLRPLAERSGEKCRLALLSAGLALTAAAMAPPAAARATPAEKLVTARQVYLEMTETRDRVVPLELIEDAVCVAVFPGVIKGAMGWGGRVGRGVLTCRNASGTWSPPAFVRLGGASFGLQIGAQSTDLVLFFMTERGVRSLLRRKVTLGGDVSVAAGPVGRTAQAGTDIGFRAEILAYARSRGLFAGLAVEGGWLDVSQKMIRRYYGEPIFPEALLFEHRAPALGGEAKAFLQVLP